MTAQDWLDRDALARHSVEPRQWMDFRQATLPDGQRIIDATNSSGLAYTILPDRGLDVWTATYNDRPLTWISHARRNCRIWRCRGSSSSTGD